MRHEARLLADVGDRCPALGCAAFAIERRQRDAVDGDLSRVRQLEPGEQMQERRLAGTGRAR